MKTTLPKQALFIHYDKDGDLLEFCIGKPTAAYFEDLGNDIFERHDEKTGEARGFIVFGFSQRTKGFKSITLPLPSPLRVPSS